MQKLTLCTMPSLSSFCTASCTSKLHWTPNSSCISSSHLKSRSCSTHRHYFLHMLFIYVLILTYVSSFMGPFFKLGKKKTSVWYFDQPGNVLVLICICTKAYRSCRLSLLHQNKVRYYHLFHLKFFAIENVNRIRAGNSLIFLLINSSSNKKNLTSCWITSSHKCKRVPLPLSSCLLYIDCVIKFRYVSMFC